MLTTQEILHAATALPDADRVQIIEGLLATFPPSPANEASQTEAWRQVAVVRAAEIDSGTARTIPWTKVEQEGDRRIHERLAH